ncbi:hypothetical protein N0V82_009216 [Gnomoniopsis sp. IMI 355080]|nr:hypothetical protein N0V82_009216 [Gnomoniopsis sp. IMI 355080]
MAQTMEIEENKKKDRWAEELPHGMPKDSDLLPPHSLALLRAARSGCLRKRPAPADDEDGDADALPGEKTEKKASAMDEGFRVRMWKQVPRSEEGSTISYLAKRHKDTITLPSKALATQTAGPTITKATVRRIDAAGNPYTQEVTVTDGQQVDGEVISTSVVPAPEQTGQVPPAVATPTRRKPPIPQKKKGRGRGRGARGRGRILPLQASARPGPQDGSAMAGTDETKNESVGPDGVKIEIEDGKAVQDVDMRDSSAVDDDGDEGEGDGDDGDDDEGDESGTPVENEDHEMEDAPDLGDSAFPSTAAADPSEAPSNLAPPTPNALNTDISRIEGSPLKNVLMRSPTDAPPQIPLMAVQPSTDLSSSGAPGGLTVDPQPSPVTSQLHQDPASEEMKEIPAQDAKPTEAATPDKSIQDTPAPETTVPETTVPEKAMQETIVQETTVPETIVPETTALQNSAPEISTREIAAPESAPLENAPLESAPLENAAPEIAAPDTATSETAAPETSGADMTLPETIESETTAPETAVPETAIPEPTVPETSMPEADLPETTATASAELGTEDTTGVVAITSAQESEVPAVPISGPTVVSPAAVEQPPSIEDAPPAVPSTADIPIPTSEDPKTGEAPEDDKAMAEPEALPVESAPAAIPAPATATGPMSVDSAPVAQTMTEDGIDDGSDLLGPLGASLSRQAEEDVPPPTSAPAPAPLEPEQLSKTETGGEREAVSEGNSGGD